MRICDRLIQVEKSYRRYCFVKKYFDKSVDKDYEIKYHVKVAKKTND